MVNSITQNIIEQLSDMMEFSAKFLNKQTTRKCSVSAQKTENFVFWTWCCSNRIRCCSNRKRCCSNKSWCCSNRELVLQQLKTSGVKFTYKLTVRQLTLCVTTTKIVGVKSLIDLQSNNKVFLTLGVTTTENQQNSKLVFINRKQN